MTHHRRTHGRTALAALAVACLTGCTTESQRLDIETLNLTVDAGDAALQVEVVGPADANKTIMFLHGGPGMSHDYMTPLAKLANEDHRLVFYDQRGGGASTDPETGDYTVGASANDIEAIRLAIGADELHLVPHSWGGAVLWAYADAHPERIASITAIGALTADVQDAITAQNNIAYRIGQLQMLGEIPIELPEDEGDDCTARQVAVAPAYFHDPELPIPASLLDTDCNQHTFRESVGANINQPAGLIEAAAAYDGPAYVYFGASDPMGRGLAESLVATLESTDAELRIIDGAGHYPWLELPTWTAELGDHFSAL